VGVIEESVEREREVRRERRECVKEEC